MSLETRLSIQEFMDEMDRQKQKYPRLDPNHAGPILLSELRDVFEAVLVHDTARLAQKLFQISVFTLRCYNCLT